MATEQLELNPDSAEGLAALIEAERRIIDDPDRDRFDKAAARTRIHCYEDRQQVLAFARKHGGLPKFVEATYKQRTPNELEVKRLEALAQKLFPPVEHKEGEEKKLQEWENFLNAQYARNSVRVAEGGRGMIGFTWDAFLEIHLLLEQFLEKQPKPKTKKKKDPATPELECKQFTAGLVCRSTATMCIEHRTPYPLDHQFQWEGDDNYNAPYGVTSIEWSQMRQWAEDNGINSTTQYALMGGLGLLGSQKGAQIPDLNGFREMLRALRLRIMKNKGITVQEPEKKKVTNINLFGNFTKTEAGTTNTETGEVVAKEERDPVTGRTPAEEAEYQQRVEDSRKALGYDRDYLPSIESRQDVTDALRERAAIMNEYAFITNNYRTATEGLQAALNGWSFLYEKQLEAWLKNNPIPGDKKTLKDNYGEIGYRNEPERYSQGDQQLLQASLALLAKDKQASEKYEIRVGEYACNWDKVKAAAIAGDIKLQDGALKHSPAIPNKFRVGPSLDTVKDHIKEGKWKPLGQS